LIRLVFSSPAPTTPRLFPSHIMACFSQGIPIPIAIELKFSGRHVAGGQSNLGGSATLAPVEAVGVSPVTHCLKKCWNGQGESPDPHFAKPEALSASYIVDALCAYIWDDEKSVSQPYVGRLYS
ncbi:hypothetical protein B0T13DRAFT_392427, partial [Neurospora crassa]